LNILRKVLGESAIYGLSSYIGVFASMFLTPIYTRILSKGDYGIMDVFLTWNNLLLTILPFGLIGGLIRYYPEYKSDIKSMTGTILVFLLVVGGLYCLTLLSFQETIILGVFNNQITFELYLINISIVIGSMFFSFSLSILRCEFKKTIFLILSLLNISLIVSLGFIFVYFDRMGVIGFFRASLITVVIMNILGFIAVRKKIALSWNTTIFRQLFNYSIHVLGVNILFQLVTFLDRKIILNYSSVDQLGIYAIGAKISSILNLIFSALLMGWLPRAMTIKDNPDFKKIMQVLHDLSWVALFPIIFSFFIFNKELIQLFAPSYNEAFLVIFFLSISIIFIGFNNLFYNTGLLILSKTKYITYASLISLSTNTTISILLAPRYGINGVAFGTFVGSFLWIIMQYLFNRKLFKIKFNLSRSFLLTSLLLITYYIFNISSHFYHLLNSFEVIIFKVIALAIVFVLSSYKIKQMLSKKSNSIVLQNILQ
jgi:O-antigen/teichoic acid export membrane protein